MFQSLKCSGQTASYASATIATISTKVMFIFRLSPRVDCFLRWPALKSFSSTHRFQLGKYWARICTTVHMIQHVVVKTGKLRRHEGKKQSIYGRDGKWGQTNITIIATCGHESISSNGHEDIMREIKRNMNIGIDMLAMSSQQSRSQI